MFEVFANDYRITIQEIPLGNQGEDMARCLVIDITDAVLEFGSGGTVSVRNKRNGDELPYFATNVTTVTGADTEGNVHTYIKWTLTDVDTAAAGSGFVQADYIISGVTVKTWVYKYFILPSLGITGDVPDPYEDILEEIEAQVSAVQTAAASAAASAAQASAEATRIISTTQEVVEDWLSEHIVTGYTVDDTLTISGAAADSKKAGDMIRAAFVTEQTSGSIASFTDGADNVPLKDLVVNIQPKQAGTGDPSPSNVRAISGWTGANITRCGKNMFALAVSGSQTVTGVTITINADGTISLSGTNTGSQRISYPIGTYTITDSNQILTGCPSGGGSSAYELIITQTGGSTLHDYGSGASLSGYAVGSTINVNLIVRPNVNATGLVFKPMIRNASDSAEYESYNGNTYNITFGTAGTVYGGTLDVTTGMLTVTHKSVKFTTADHYGNSGSFGYYAWCTAQNPADIYTPYNAFVNLMCDTYKPVSTAAGRANLTVYAIAGIIYFVNNEFTSVANAAAVMAEQQPTVVYPLANPVSVQLDATTIKTLLGNNNIWSDTGSVASCEYRADTKLYIEHLTTPDGDMIADANITSGSYFMVNNNLYLATANIANGGAIIPGTNCTATNLAAALNAINS